MTDDEEALLTFVEGMITGLMLKHTGTLINGSDAEAFYEEFEQMVWPMMRDNLQVAKLREVLQMFESDAQEDCDGKGPSCSWEKGRRYGVGVIKDEIEGITESDE